MQREGRNSLSVSVDVVLSLRESPDNGVGGPEDKGEDGESDVGLTDSVRSKEGALSASDEESVDLRAETKQTSESNRTWQCVRSGVATLDRSGWE